MTQYFDGMLDIESMGGPPTGALVGLGFCFFDLTKDDPIGPTFSRAINLATAVKAGMTIDASAVMWWMAQGDEARRSIMWQAQDLKKTLIEFNEFLAEHSRPRDLRVYGNSPSFDLQIMASAYKLTDTPCPWHYTNERDFRTVRAMYPSVVYDPSEKGTDAHSAVHDAIFQARHLHKIKNRHARKQD